MQITTTLGNSFRPSNEMKMCVILCSHYPCKITQGSSQMKDKEENNAMGYKFLER